MVFLEHKGESNNTDACSDDADPDDGLGKESQQDVVGNCHKKDCGCCIHVTLLGNDNILIGLFDVIESKASDEVVKHIGVELFWKLVNVWQAELVEN